MSIIGISSSPRRGGNSDLILGNILKGTRADASTLYLSDIEFSSCVGCERCRNDGICTRFDDGLTPWYDAISGARGMVLVSPVYNYNITSWMKAFIDRLYCFYDFDDERPRGWSSRLAGQARFAVIAVVAEQVGEDDLGMALQALRMPAMALGYQIAGELVVTGKFEAGIVGKDAHVLKQCSELGAKLARALGNES